MFKVLTALLLVLSQIFSSESSSMIREVENMSKEEREAVLSSSEMLSESRLKFIVQFPCNSVQLSSLNLISLCFVDSLRAIK